MAETFDSDNAAGPNGLHEFDVGADANWVRIDLPDYARRFFIQADAALELAYFTANGDGGAAVAADKRFPIQADSPWSQPLSRGKGTGITSLYVRDSTGAATPHVYVGAEAFEGG